MQINNKLNGCSLEQNGEDFYIVGADAVRKKLCNLDLKIGAQNYTDINKSGTCSVTVPIDCKSGLLLLTWYGYNDTIRDSLSATFNNSAGIKSKKVILDRDAVSRSFSAFVSLYSCEFNPGEQITITFKNTYYNYGYSDIRILY